MDDAHLFPLTDNVVFRLKVLTSFPFVIHVFSNVVIRVEGAVVKLLGGGREERNGGWKGGWREGREERE